jgi:O-antigen/teichoic acid export membrane protein
MTAGLSAIARDLLEAVVGAPYVPSAGVVAWTAVGVLFQGMYLLTSIGLNITKNTQFYPAATLAAAATSVGLNLAFIPRYGMIGAAWSNAAAYALQAALAFKFSQRVYPVRYETDRLARIAAAAVVAWAVAYMLPPTTPLVGVMVRGGGVVIIYVCVLAATGFFRREELAVLSRLSRRPLPAVPSARAETTELAGEIVAAELPAEIVGEQTSRGEVR